MTTRRLLRNVARFAILPVVPLCLLAAAGPYHVVRRIPIPGDFGWDYITADTEGRRFTCRTEANSWSSTSIPARPQEE